MNKQLKQFLIWSPRILSIGFILFLGLFATDVFGEYETIGETALALFMHLIPNFVLLIALIIAWRWKLIGGVIFLLLGVVSVFAFDTFEHPIAFLVISLPVYIIGFLFLADSLTGKLDPVRHAS